MSRALRDAGVEGRLADASFRFWTDAAELGEYAHTHLAGFSAAAVSAPCVDSRLRWHEGQPPSDRAGAFSHLSAMERVDRDLYVAGGELHWFRVDDLRDLYLRLRWEGGKLRVEGDYFHRLANTRRADQARRLLYRHRVAALRRRRFTTLLYYLVYYPCWWWLEQTQDLHPIHAAGVCVDSTVVLLAGASGVRKSTLAVALASTPGGRLLSDSFVLHQGTHVCAVPEPVLLDGRSRRWLGEHGRELQPIDWRYCLNRDGYHLPVDRRAAQGSCGLLLFPRHSLQPYVRRISAEQAHQRLSAGDLIINDLRRYWAFAAIMEQVVAGKLVSRRELHLAQLAAQVPCYEIGLTAEMTCAASVDAIRQLLPTTPLRAVATRQ